MVSSLLEVIDNKQSKKIARTAKPMSAHNRLVANQTDMPSLTARIEGLQGDEGDSGESNDYLVFAKPILTLITQIKMSTDVPDVNKLHQQAVTEMGQYISALEAESRSTFLIDCSAYCLCAALDEAVLSKEWGTQSIWVQESLLSMFRSETLGGERFYLIAEKMCEEPRKYLGVIELIYTLLSLGFEGQYYGPYKEQRNQVKNQLYQIISQTKGKVAKQLSPHSLDNRTIAFREKRKVKIKRILITSLIVIAILYVWYSYEIFQVNKYNIESLKKVGRVAPVTTFIQLIGRNKYSQRTP
jgi:type VI secretion system protein ImpK